MPYIQIDRKWSRLTLNCRYLAETRRREPEEPEKCREPEESATRRTRNFSLQLEDKHHFCLPHQRAEWDLGEPNSGSVSSLHLSVFKGLSAPRWPPRHWGWVEGAWARSSQSSSLTSTSIFLLRKRSGDQAALRYSHVSTFLPPCTISGGWALLPLSPAMFSFFPFLVLSL